MKRFAQETKGKKQSYIYKTLKNCQTKNLARKKSANFVMEWVEND